VCILTSRVRTLVHDGVHAFHHVRLFVTTAKTDVGHRFFFFKRNKTKKFPTKNNTVRYDIRLSTFPETGSTTPHYIGTIVFIETRFAETRNVSCTNANLMYNIYLKTYNPGNRLEKDERENWYRPRYYRVGSVRRGTRRRHTAPAKPDTALADALAWRSLADKKLVRAAPPPPRRRTTPGDHIIEYRRTEIYTINAPPDSSETVFSSWTQTFKTVRNHCYDYPLKYATR